jgi:hypothetical protein
MDSFHYALIDITDPSYSGYVLRGQELEILRYAI